jgi:hypothetical protein
MDERARFTPVADDHHRYEGIVVLCEGIDRLWAMMAAPPNDRTSSAKAVATESASKSHLPSLTKESGCGSSAVSTALDQADPPPNRAKIEDGVGITRELSWTSSELPC